MVSYLWSEPCHSNRGTEYDPRYRFNFASPNAGVVRVADVPATFAANAQSGLPCNGFNRRTLFRALVILFAFFLAERPDVKTA
jgi:hypothetical protein